MDLRKNHTNKLLAGAFLAGAVVCSLIFLSNASSTEEKPPQRSGTPKSHQADNPRIAHPETLEKMQGQIAEADKEKKLLVVKFYADWCPPCQQMRPIFNALANLFPQVLFAEVNVENKEISKFYDIRSIPAFLFIWCGETIDQQVGAMSQAKFEEKIRKALQGRG